MDSWTTFAKAYDKCPPGRLLVYSRFGQSTDREDSSAAPPEGRDLVAWIPFSAIRGGGPYPVLYLLDGQNLFDERQSHSGSWGVSDIMENLALEGLEAIVVGIPNAGQHRMKEYTPKFSKKKNRPLEDAFLQELTNQIAPAVEDRFNIDPQRRLIGGSSLGALFSLFAFFAQPGFFRGVLALSPSLHVGGRRLREFVRQGPSPTGRIYLDTGTEEVIHARPGFDSHRFTANAIALSRLLHRKGYRDGSNQLFSVDEGASHSEAAWARRLPGALRYLLHKHGEH